MPYGKTVAARPGRPVLVYDGQCEFCRRWVGRLRARTGAAVEYVASQSDAIGLWFPELPADQFMAGVVLIETDGRVYRAAEAAIRLWARGPHSAWVLRLYRVPGCAGLAEFLYRQIAKRRHCLR